jgi:hypothetical protein
MYVCAVKWGERGGAKKGMGKWMKKVDCDKRGKRKKERKERRKERRCFFWCPKLRLHTLGKEKTGTRTKKRFGAKQGRHTRLPSSPALFSPFCDKD